MRSLTFITLSLCFATSAMAETVTVAAAVSLREALTEISTTFKSETGHDVRFVFGSSGQLMGQVRNGAPIGVFISAADKQVDDLATEGLVVEATRRVIAGNSLVLVVPRGAKSPPTGFADLADARHKHIAIGDPKTVPAGDYAMQVLASLKTAEAVSTKVIHGTNVRQVLGYVEAGEVDAGIVYFTDALQSGDKVQVVERADERLHAPIRYTAVVVKATKRQGVAQQFLDHLDTDSSRRVLEDKGFTVETKSKRARKP
jgi:molybdate transport system substrate-binding protein